MFEGEYLPWLVGVVLLVVFLVFYCKVQRVWTRIDRMIDAAKDGTFEETEFDEGKLSRLESKMYQYLLAGDRKSVV